jgi:peptide/nickel transport system permease protein
VTTARSTSDQALEQRLTSGLSRIRPRSLWRDAFHKLLLNKGAVGGGIIFVIIVIVAIAAPLLAPHDPIGLSPRDSLRSPGLRFWMGTDQFGRDILSRVIYGARISVTMGFVAVSISVTSGTALGLVAGYYRGLTDSLVGRLVDVMLAFPGILLALVIIAILGPDLRNAMIAVGISAMPLYIRVVRGSVLSVAQAEYIEAARVSGANDLRILTRHVLPNVLAPIIVLASLGIPSAIIAGAALSFLGLGVRPPTADWGEMLSSGRQFMNTAWWLSTFPGIAIVVMVLAINLLGDGLRDALDPRVRL